MPYFLIQLQLCMSGLQYKIPSHPHKKIKYAGNATTAVTSATCAEVATQNMLTTQGLRCYPTRMDSTVRTLLGLRGRYRTLRIMRNAAPEPLCTFQK